MKRIAEPWLALLAFALVLSNTWEAGYRLFSFETGLAIGAALLLTAWASIVASFHPALRMGCVALLFALLVARHVTADPSVATLIVAVTAVALGALHRRVQPHFLAVFAIVFAGAKSIGPPQDGSFRASAAQAGQQPVSRILVHWVMDELGSFESVPEAWRPQGQVEELRRAYAARGFHIHPNQPSFTPETKDSLGALVGGHGEHVEEVVRHNAYRIPRNTLHRLFVSQGWNVSITQSAYLDFCTDPAFECTTYAIGRSAHLLREAGLSWRERAAAFERILMASLTGQSAEAWRRATPALPLTVLRAMDSSIERVHASSGKHYAFGHFLFPHFPWVVDQACGVKALAQWQLPYAARASKAEADLAAAFEAYWAQAYCAHRRILQMVDRLDAAFPGRVSFLIHGDHGPRILERSLPAAGGAALDERTRRNLLEPFIAARMESGSSAVNGGSSMQSLVQALLLTHAHVDGQAPIRPSGSRPGLSP